MRRDTPNPDDKDKPLSDQPASPPPSAAHDEAYPKPDYSTRFHRDCIPSNYLEPPPAEALTQEYFLKYLRHSLPGFNSVDNPNAANDVALLKMWEPDIKKLTPGDLQTVSRLANRVGQLITSTKDTSGSVTSNGNDIPALKADLDNILEPYRHNPEHLLIIARVASLELTKEHKRETPDGCNMTYTIDTLDLLPYHKPGAQLRITNFGLDPKKPGVKESDYFIYTFEANPNEANHPKK